MRPITAHRGQAIHTGARFSPDAKALYYLTNRDAEFTYVERFDLASGQKRVIDKPAWDVMYHSFSRDGRYRILSINEDARTKISVYEATDGTPVRMPVLPDGDITSAGFSPSGKLLRFQFSGDRTPPDLFVLDLSTGQHRRLTNNLSSEIRAGDLVEANVVRYRSFDGIEIPSILLKPHQATPANKAPALVWVHGGPGGQSRKGYSAVQQYLANHGYVILAVNNRGSTGYGKSFYIADDRKHGREPLWDCIEAKKYLASLDYVDPDKIGILGGSYGGYMALAALTLKPEEFAVGVDLFGISNWVRTLESVPPYWEGYREALYAEIGHPEKDRDMLLTISPLFHADRIVRPLMVLQGANDRRVIKQESDDIVAAVRKNKGTVEYIVFDDEGHGFAKKANQIKGYGAVLTFLNKYLRGDSR
jgi:dipeptidyl aminopeptidase/acylaminoacyl peptidase